MNRMANIRTLIETLPTIAYKLTDKDVSDIAVVILRVMQRPDKEKAPTDGNQ